MTEKPDGKNPVLDRVVFIKKDGSKAEMRNCVCTSSHFGTRTRNFKCLDSGEIRKVRDVLIIGINDMEVFI